MRISLIVAMGVGRVIGVDNKLPWHLPEDLKRFRALTTGHPIIMGRKTYESIGKPLPNRTNIVISRQAHLAIPGVARASSLEEAFEKARDATGSEEVFVIGGGEIYRQALKRVDRMHITQVLASVKGDAFFPEWPESDFNLTESQAHAEGPTPYRFEIWDRVK